MSLLTAEGRLVETGSWMMQRLENRTVKHERRKAGPHAILVYEVMEKGLAANKAFDR